MSGEVEVYPPEVTRPVKVEQGFVHTPHQPDEDCPLGDLCDAPRKEWGTGGPMNQRPFFKAGGTDD